MDQSLIIIIILFLSLISSLTFLFFVVLGLSNNGITEISKFISKMSSIEVLYLSGNSIAALPKEIKDLKKLEVTNAIPTEF